MSTRKEQKQQARARRLQLEAARRERDRRRRRRAGLAAAATTLLVLGGGAAAIGGGGHSASGQTPVVPPSELASLASLGKLNQAGPAGAVGPEGVSIPAAPPLTGTSSASTGSSVDGMRCQGAEQILFHIHAHLTMFVDGAARRIPYGVGIPGAQVTPTPAGPYVAAGSCFYWLHTHAADGIIHVESPVERTYTLGNFFDIWRQQLSPTQVGSATGPVTALYNGQVFRGDPRNIPLTKHAQIQLEVGRPLVAPVEIRFPDGL